MNKKIIKNDFLKSKLITLTTMLFVAAAALLISLAAILWVNLTGAVDTLMQEAKTPHFLQMHAGAIDTARLDSFADSTASVEKYQTLEFLNIDSASIRLGENTLAGSTQDNGFSVQSEHFDYLLDLDGNTINAAEGELYVPICYLLDNNAKIGDRAMVGGVELRVAGFLRDSQMNSMLSSSKRFLVSQEDYVRISDLGNVEYLIEFRLHDMAELSAFEAAYVADDLPANGPTITYPLIKMMNALSDGILIGVILLVSVLVVLIALLCIRFTLLAKIEEDYREIGVMKAIGLRLSDIRQIYVAKYAAVGAFGCVLGYGLSFLFQGVLTESIRLTMGESNNAVLGGLLGLLGVLLIFAIVLLYVSGVLRRFRSISAAQAIRFGFSSEKRRGGAGPALYKSHLFSPNILLGIKDVLNRKGLFATMLIVLILAAFILIVPQNLYTTISADSFATYMGIGDCDIRMDIQQTDHIEEKTAEIAAWMEHDGRIDAHTELTTKNFSIKNANGMTENIKVELGDHSRFPVSYAKGSAPAEADEIALSVIYAEEFGKAVGDTLILETAQGEKALIICGIYSDITNGGKTAKAAFEDGSADTMWSILYVSLAEQAALDDTVQDYAKAFPYAKVTDTKEYIKQTYGQTLFAVKQSAIAAVAVAILIIVLVTLLFMKLLVAKDRYEIAVMKACGFTNADIRLQYGTRAVFVLILGVLLGTLLANTIGAALVGIVISSFGAAAFRFTVHPLLAYLLCPALMLCALLAGTWLGTKDAGSIQISESIKE